MHENFIYSSKYVQFIIYILVRFGVCSWVSEGILAFDTITDTFREIEPPARVVGRYINFGGVGVYFFFINFWFCSFARLCFVFRDVFIFGM